MSKQQKIITLESSEGTKSFLTERFLGLTNAKISALVNVEFLSIFGNDLSRGFNLESFDLERFFSMVIKLLANTQTEVKSLDGSISMIRLDTEDSINKAMPYDITELLMPLALEVAEFNGFFKFLGLESSVKQIMEQIQSNLGLQKLLSDLNKLQIETKKLETLQEIEIEKKVQDYMKNPENYQTKKNKKSSKASVKNTETLEQQEQEKN